MPITDSIGQLIERVSFVFGRLCSCHSVIALGGQFSWNWSKVAVNRDLLNVERAVWFPVFWTCHRPHHVSGVRGPGNGSLFFRWIAYVIYSGSCLIPLRRSPSATAINFVKLICPRKIIRHYAIRPLVSGIWLDKMYCGVWHAGSMYFVQDTFIQKVSNISTVMLLTTEDIGSDHIFSPVWCTKPSPMLKCDLEN